MDQKHILIIDDNESIRRSFELALEDTGYPVTTVDSGEKGITEIKKGHYQLVFLNLNMPGMNGVQTLRAIRDLFPNLPVCIISAFHKEFLAELDDARKKGLQFQLLRKPIGAAEIEALARSVLDKNPSNLDKDKE